MEYGKRALAWLCACVTATLVCLSLPAHAGDGIEGKWYGKAGRPTDRVDLGFEFKRDKGVLQIFLYVPVANFFGLPVPGTLTQDGDTYTNKDWMIRLTLKGGVIDGTMFYNNIPLSLARTDTLPTETPLPDLPTGPGPKWQTKLGAAIYARAALRDGTAYVGTSGGMFYAINLKDGTFAWAFAAGRPVFGEALATDDAVYFVCDNGFLFKLDRKTGREIWRYDLGDARIPRILPHQVIANSGDFDYEIRASKPLLVDGVLYVGSGDGGLNAVAPATGKQVWRFQGQGKIRGDVVADGPRLFFGTFDNFLYAVERKTGTLLWQKDTKGPITSSVAIVDGKLIAGNRYGLLGGFDPATGSKLWTMQLWGSALESTAAPAGGSLFYIGSSDLRRISLMDAKDGRVVWRTDVFGWPWARPELAGDRLYVSVAGGTPYSMRQLPAFEALDARTGAILWRWPMPDSPGSWTTGFYAPPAAQAGLVVVGGLDGSLYAFPN